MSLRNIISEIAANEGVSLTNSSEKSLLVARINRAARELYHTKTLFGSLFEEVFDLNVSANQVSLPWYVKHVKAIRWFDGRYAIDLEDINNRYFSGPDTEIWRLRFREKERSPLAREISNESVLIFSIPLVESTDIVITIAGPTDNSALKTESVTIPAGSLSVLSIGNYKDPVKSIRKNRVTDNDVTVRDVDGNDLGIIPNHLLRSDYNVVQILDGESPPPDSHQDAIEVLFEKQWTPFVNDDDEFIFGDDYDDAIIWKYMEHQSKDVENGLVYQEKCQQVIDNIWIKAKAGVKRRINFKPNAFFNQPYKDIGYPGYTYPDL